MSQRFDFFTEEPGLMEQFRTFDTAVKQSGIDSNLLHLIKIRASQLNGCAYCLNMHINEALQDGMEEKKIHLITVWPESALFSPQEQLVLAYCESVTLIHDGGVSEEQYEELTQFFSVKEIARLTLAIAAINVWNRLMIVARKPHS